MVSVMKLQIVATPIVKGKVVAPSSIIVLENERRPASDIGLAVLKAQENALKEYFSMQDSDAFIRVELRYV